MEIATGPGLLAKHVAPAAASMIATDYSEGMIKEARKGKMPSNLSFEVADATVLPFDNGSFDVVIIANALHIMNDPNKTLSEIRRVLSSHGLLIAPNFVNHASGNVLWMKALQCAGVKVEHCWTSDTYLQYIKKQGWEVIFVQIIPARITVMYAECIPK